MKINLDITVKQGRVTLNGKTYDKLNDDEKKVMDGLLKKIKTKNGTKRF